MRDDVDVVLVPLMVRRAVQDELIGAERDEEAGANVPKEYLENMVRILSKIRICRSADRVTKKIFGDKFSV